MERATGFEPAWALRRLLGRQSPSSSRPSPHEAGHVAPNAEAFGTGVPTSPGRRCDARANDNPLAALLHGGPVFGIRIVKELHLSVRCRAQWRGRRNKKPGGLAHSPGWNSVVLGVWPYGPPPLPGVRARFVSGWPKCKRASPRADIESMLAQTQYGRPLRPAMARGVVSVLRVVELMTRSRRIQCMLKMNLAKVKQP